MLTSVQDAQHSQGGELLEFDPDALKADLDAQGVKHFGTLPKGWDGAASELIKAVYDDVDTKGLLLAVIGRAHFGNPIPQPWYAAAQEFLSSCHVEAQRPNVDRPRNA